jgi:endonuclease/exonuclease/phosphatase family metal-dependent hydrolase
VTIDDLAPYGELIETRLRVLTWNLWWRHGPWEARRPLITAEIERLAPDVVALQEVWGERDGTTFAAELADGLGYHHVDAALLVRDGITFGNAVLSRWPIIRHDHRQLPAPPDREELRTVLFAETNGPRGPVQVFSTHLNWRFDHSDVRQDQVQTIAELVAECAPRTFPPVVCGDFNAAPDSEEIRLMTGRATLPVSGLVFHDAWEAAGDGGPGTTWSNANPFAAVALEPERRIDYVFVGWPKAGGAGHVTRCEVVGTAEVDGMVPSDHYGVLAELRY